LDLGRERVEPVGERGPPGGECGDPVGGVGQIAAGAVEDHVRAGAAGPVGLADLAEPRLPDRGHQREGRPESVECGRCRGTGEAVLQGSAAYVLHHGHVGREDVVAVVGPQ
jgi:hypothetical protein